MNNLCLLLNHFHHNLPKCYAACERVSAKQEKIKRSYSVLHIRRENKQCNDSHDSCITFCHLFIEKITSNRVET